MILPAGTKLDSICANDDSGEVDNLSPLLIKFTSKFIAKKLKLKLDCFVIKLQYFQFKQLLFSFI